MVDRLERLSLSDVQSLARDVLARAGARDETADAIGRMVRLAESSGLPRLGLERVPHLVELIRTGVADPQALAEPESTAPALLRLDARRGFADAAFDAWSPAFETSIRAHGIASLALHNCADQPSPILSATAMALRGLAAMAMPDQTGAQVAAMVLPAADKRGPLLRFDLDGSDMSPWGPAFTALIADALPDLPRGGIGTPAVRSISLIGLLPGPGAELITGALIKRHSYSALTLDLHDTVVQSSLLERIFNA